MASYSRVAYPQPPPMTRNDLSKGQRDQLMRTTRKLEKVLGTAPQVEDSYGHYQGPVRLELPTGSSRRSYEDFSPTSSVSSSGSSRSSSPPTSISRTSSRTSSTHSSSSDESHRSRRDEKHSTRVSTTHRPPLLRLVFNSYESEHSPTYADMHNTVHFRAPSRTSVKPSLPTIPASPAYAQPAYSPFSPPPKSQQLDSRSIHSLGESSSREERERRLSIPGVPEFKIPSESSARRAKMEHLRRHLGEGVPVEMVYGRREESVAEPASEEEDGFDPTASIRPYTKSSRPREAPRASRSAPSPPKTSTSYSSPHRTAKVVEPTSSSHKISLMRSPVEEPRSTISRSSSSSSSSSSNASSSRRKHRERELGDIDEDAEDEYSPSSRSSWKMPSQSRVPVPSYH